MRQHLQRGGGGGGGGVLMDSERQRGLWFGPQSHGTSLRTDANSSAIRTSGPSELPRLSLLPLTAALSSIATMHVSLRAQSLFAVVLVATVLVSSCASSSSSSGRYEREASQKGVPIVPPSQRTSCVREVVVLGSDS